MADLEVPVSARIEQFRQKAASSGLTLEEAREAVALLRQGRRSAAEAPKKASTKKSKEPIDADKLLDDLENI